jgi:hypothetical protein
MCDTVNTMKLIMDLLNQDFSVIDSPVSSSIAIYT